MFLFVRAILFIRNSNSDFFLAKLKLPSRVNFVQLSFNLKVSNTHLVTKTIDFSHKNWLSLENFLAPNVIIRGFNFQKVDHSKLLNCTEMKTSMLSTLRLFLSRFFIVSLPFSIQLPERHNRKKEKFQKNLFLSNFYQKTNLKQVMGQNS